MSPRARRHSGGPGWGASLAGALALVVLGFAVGLVAGVTFEDPGLVVRYVAGQTEDVELASLEAADVPPARSPLGVHGDPGLRAAASGAPEARLPAVSAAVPREGFVVQVGSFGDADSAGALRDRLDRDGFPSYVEQAESEGGRTWRVRVGPWSEKSDAERTAHRLKQEQKLPTWVLESRRP
ncbi:MAG: SPOR domain-containing protein [Myxococcota bacterium]